MVASKAGSKVKDPQAPTAKKSRKKTSEIEILNTYDSYEHNGVTYNVGDDGKPMAHAQSCILPFISAPNFLSSMGLISSEPRLSLLLLACPPPIVYLVETDNLALLPDESDETDVCRVCHKQTKTGSDMLECSRCLGGFHMKCLKPALKAVPKVRPRARTLSPDIPVYGICRLKAMFATMTGRLDVHCL